ncbi:MAG TPA: glucosyl-3-phosphoglycerate synthase [Roseiflexaceae bacterium]|nr:glucosyl-3-phosphoglycerate synthase [Roseiflexaceae bacterium]HMP38831.1 glucosyl-3-phosphoglycerate synthase [Roseiflexaceae bacterium]
MEMPQYSREVHERDAAESDYLVLLPVLDIEEARQLLPFAIAIARPYGGRVGVLNVVTVPDDQPLSEGMLEARRIRARLDEIDDLNREGETTVRTIVTVAYSLEEGIRTVAGEQGADIILIGWQEDHSSSERLFGPPIDDLLRNPPCDVVVVHAHDDQPWQRLLLPVRGGPHTQLACSIALALADQHDAAITVLYASDPRRPDDIAVRENLQSLRAMPRVGRWLERAIPARQAILAESPDHQAIVLGVTGRRGDPEAPIGSLADQILRNADSTVVLVRHRLAPAQEQAQQIWQQQRDLSATVDRWFAENTFSSTEFEDPQRLLALKQQQGVTISLALPALNEEETIGEIIGILKRTLIDELPLIDELVLIDSRSEDRTREIAESYGIPVYVHQDILPQYGSFTGKGEALWKSLFVLRGDIVAWVDTDIKNFHPRFVYGILGPLLREPQIQYAKGFYRRPIQMGETVSATGGGRVTELTARPLLNLFYPELSGVVQPLSGEYAGRREALEGVPFFTGYGVETGLIIDLLEQYGLGALAQVDLQQRIHRNQELIPLSKMAFAIIQVIIQRLEQRQRVQLVEPVNQSMKLIRYGEGEGFHLDVREIRDHERPPMSSIPEYRRLRGMPPLPRNRRTL